ncbi:MAG TPA: SDR family oxidoreductase [Baekduia sp.]|nr:SDR family oxidoreductase [Baekduia sp.]
MLPASLPLPESLSGQSVLVIGGTSGIGEAAAKLLMHVGADVTVASRSIDADADGGPDTPRRLRIDVTDEEQLEAALARLDTIHHVYVTAGGFVPGGLSEMDPQAARELLLSRADDVLRVARVAVPRMAPNGSLTFTSANSAEFPTLGGTGSGAAVAALEGVVRALALELAPKIRVNAIRVGLADTQMMRRAFPTDEAMAELGAPVPLKRVGQPEEIASAALFLMANAYMTAAVITVDGGGWLA